MWLDDYWTPDRGFYGTQHVKVFLQLSKTARVDIAFTFNLGTGQTNKALRHGAISDVAARLSIRPLGGCSAHQC